MYIQPHIGWLGLDAEKLASSMAVSKPDAAGGTTAAEKVSGLRLGDRCPVPRSAVARLAGRPK